MKIGLVLQTLGGDTRDREPLLLPGTLDELARYAAIALHRSQPDGDQAVHTLAQRVAGRGRIHAVRTLRDTTDPEAAEHLRSARTHQQDKPRETSP